MEKLNVAIQPQSAPNSLASRIKHHLSKSYEVVHVPNNSFDFVFEYHQLYSKKYWLSVLSANHIATAAVCDTPEQALLWLLEDDCVILRKKVKTKVIFKEIYTPDDLEDKGIYKKVYKNSQELRAHVCNGHLVALYQKVPVDENNVKSEYVKTIENGYKYTTKVTVGDKITIKNIISTIAYTFGYQFFAVDFIYDEETKALLVADVLVNPPASDKTLDRYVKALLGKKTPKQQPKLKKSKSVFSLESSLYSIPSPFSVDKATYDELVSLTKSIKQSEIGILYDSISITNDEHDTDF